MVRPERRASALPEWALHGQGRLFRQIRVQANGLAHQTPFCKPLDAARLHGATELPDRNLRRNDGDVPDQGDHGLEVQEAKTTSHGVARFEYSIVLSDEGVK